VYTLPGEAFEKPGHWRLSLTATDAMVDRALPILAEAIQMLSTRRTGSSLLVNCLATPEGSSSDPRQRRR
jgi:hypothetical protein